MINQKNKIALASLRRDISKLKNPNKAKVLAWFFKTGPGQYGEGDKFFGLVVPVCRQLAKKYWTLNNQAVKNLLESPWHEERLIALLILVKKFEQGDKNEQKKVFDFYLKNTKKINNWDLVDLSAPNIIGWWLVGKNHAILKKLSRSKSLWEKRISIVATFPFIKNGDPKTTLQIAHSLLGDKHDLIHKAVGWMLREVGKSCSKKILLEFIRKNYLVIPRTTLRYAIEHFPEPKRKKLLAGNFK